MPTAETLLIFTLAALLMNISPGPSNFYVLARSMAQGPRAGLVAAGGLAVGAMVHVAAATFGLSALIMVSAEAFTVLKWAGAAYLIWLGIRQWRQGHVAGTGVSTMAPKPDRAIFRESVLVEVLNPKTALFFLALLPQFLEPAQGSIVLQSLILGGIAVLSAIPCDALVAFGSGALAKRMARSPWLSMWQNRLSGAVLIGLGAFVALGERPQGESP